DHVAKEKPDVAVWSCSRGVSVGGMATAIMATDQAVIAAINATARRRHELLVGRNKGLASRVEYRARSAGIAQDGGARRSSIEHRVAAAKMIEAGKEMFLGHPQLLQQLSGKERPVVVPVGDIHGIANHHDEETISLLVADNRPSLVGDIPVPNRNRPESRRGAVRSRAG